MYQNTFGNTKIEKCMAKKTDMSEKYKSIRIVDGKPRKVIVDENGTIINKNPTEDELKGLNKFPEKSWRNKQKYTDEELLDYLRQFEKKYGRPPVEQDFENNLEYPQYITFIRRFGSWQNGLKLVQLDIESLVKNGILDNSKQKGRFAEIMVRDHFKNNPIDLAGDSSNSHCDGICPNGKIYDVKSSKLRTGEYWYFNTRNKYKEMIEIYYLLAFDEDYTKLLHGWRIPGWIVVEKEQFYVGIYTREFNVENMKDYEITDKLKDVIGRGR